MTQTMHLTLDGQRFQVRTTTAADGRVTYECSTGDEASSGAGPWQPIGLDLSALGPGTASVLLPDGTSLVARLEHSPLATELVLGSTRYRLAQSDPRSLAARRSATDIHTGPLTLTSPMPGRIVRILKPPGTVVAAKEGILMIEAMKMQNEIKTPQAGMVQSILVAEGDSVVAGQALAVIH